MIVTIADVATFIATVIAVIALYFAWAQLKSQSGQLKSQREATVLGIYRQYLDLAVRYPQYAQPNYTELSKHRGSDLYTQYEWFVSSMLYACEAALDLFSDRQDWMEGIKEQLRYHLEYLNTTDFTDYEKHWNRELRHLIAEVRAED